MMLAASTAAGEWLPGQWPEGRPDQCTGYGSAGALDQASTPRCVCLWSSEGAHACVHTVWVPVVRACEVHVHMRMCGFERVSGPGVWTAMCVHVHMADCIVANAVHVFVVACVRACNVTVSYVHTFIPARCDCRTPTCSHGLASHAVSLAENSELCGCATTPFARISRHRPKQAVACNYATTDHRIAIMTKLRGRQTDAAAYEDYHGPQEQMLELGPEVAWAAAPTARG